MMSRLPYQLNSKEFSHRYTQIHTDKEEQIPRKTVEKLLCQYFLFCIYPCESVFICGKISSLSHPLQGIVDRFFGEGKPG